MDWGGIFHGVFMDQNVDWDGGWVIDTLFSHSCSPSVRRESPLFLLSVR